MSQQHQAHTGATGAAHHRCCQASPATRASGRRPPYVHGFALGLLLAACGTAASAQSAITPTTAAAAKPYVEPGKAGDPASWRTPDFVTNWGLGVMKAEHAYARGAMGQGVKIGLVDSGVFSSHEAFRGGRLHLLNVKGVYGTTHQVYTVERGVPFNPPKFHVAGTPFNVSSEFDPRYNDSHGTEMTALAGGARHGKTMHGVAFKADLYMATTSGSDNNQLLGSNDLDYNYFKAAYDALGNAGARIVNNSYGQAPRVKLEEETGDTRRPAAALSDLLRANRNFWSNSVGVNDLGVRDRKTFVDAAVDAQRQYGYVQVFSAINQDYAYNPAIEAAQPFFHPDLEGGWLVAAAYDQSGASVYNQCGYAKWSCMMGVSGMLSASIKGPTVYDNANGTSASAPNLSGALAVVMSRFPYLTNAQALQVMLSTGRIQEASATQTGGTGKLTYRFLTQVQQSASEIPNEIGGWGLPDLQRAMDGPTQLLDHMAVHLPNSTSDTWSNPISDVALQAREADDKKVVAAMRALLAGGQWNIDNLRDIYSQGWVPVADDAPTRFDHELLIELIRNGGSFTHADRTMIGDLIRDWDAAIAKRGLDPLTGKTYVGSLEKRGGGELTLAGANTYHGTTWVREGGLVIAKTGTLAGASVVEGEGTLTVAGKVADVKVNHGGTLLASGTTGAVQVSGGRAALDGASGTVVVAAGGLVQGTGTLAALNAAAGGRVAPGHSVGTLKVAGDATFARGATYAVELARDGRGADLLQVAGQATLQGGALSVELEHTGRPVTAADLQATLGKRQTVLTAGRGISGKFATVTSPYPFLGGIPTYGATSLAVALGRNAVPFAQAAADGNGRAVGTAMESLPQANGAYVALLTSRSTAEARTLLRQFDGSVYANTYAMLAEQSRHVRGAAFDQLDDAQRTPGPDGRVRIWTRLLGAWSRDRAASGYTTDTSGFLAGADTRVREGLRVGALAGYGHQSLRMQGAPASARVDTLHLGAYAGWQIGGLALRGGLAGSWSQGKVRRELGYGGANHTARNTLSARTSQVFGEAAYRGMPAHAIRVEPFGRIAYARVDGEGHTESGSDAALRLGSSGNHTVVSTLGLRLGHDAVVGAARVLRLDALLGWQHRLAGRAMRTRLSFAAGGQPFNAESVPLSGDAAVLGLSAAGGFGKNGMLAVSYNGTLGGQYAEHAVSANLRWAF